MSLRLARTHLKKLHCLYGFYLEVNDVKWVSLNQVKAVVDLKDFFPDNLKRSSVLPQVSHVLRPTQSRVQAVVGLKDTPPDDLKRLSVHP